VAVGLEVATMGLGGLVWYLAGQINGEPLGFAVDYGLQVLLTAALMWVVSAWLQPAMRHRAWLPLLAVGLPVGEIFYGLIFAAEHDRLERCEGGGASQGGHKAGDEAQ
jgi:hypothetical protein